ncbi:tol-pal system-associated acyl-CoA thioesterase [Halomonas sp. M1]|uniref:tol-pal system-associated acyl-CoA thioesterase n=1 Tax=unclassified Halomonas TaxID=2609666 RepID=UPI00023A4FDD|nr:MULTISPECIES: tol-pal system-associated acyl-CoA thioesterase [unclassified Halomonas]AVI63438.1 tol-pal system-associated acyl-CoA thioesterase [Halomonas sp. GFAJ-1]EHK62607.1 4-hydroxybenzoyl-CoA thioesterase [Halomonas sp. GFAJ-1]MDP3534580.1 tol-pal system-associated acyl-CoA thioesterase [Halomonas sp.]WFE71911.1 tol-pal system-associated acyl-CoA thioesterase [Halomonas sp. M1]
MSHGFTMPIRVYMEDTDAGGIVYYVNYLKFMERARSDWLRELGINQQMLLDEGTQLVVYRLACHYAKPARLDDQLVVSASVETIGRCRMTFEQQVRRNEELLCAATVEIACLSAKTLKPKKWPATLSLLGEA